MNHKSRAMVLAIAASLVADCGGSVLTVRCNLGTDGTLFYVIRLEPSVRRATLLYDAVYSDMYSLPERTGTLRVTDAQYDVTFPAYTKAMDDNRTDSGRIATYPGTPDTATLLPPVTYRINRYTQQVSSAEWTGRCETLDAESRL